MTDIAKLPPSRELLEAAMKTSPFTTWIGTELLHFEPGQVEIAANLRREMTQHHGFAHGAVVGYMADTVCAWAAASVAGDVVTSEYKLNLLAPAVGQRLYATGTVIKAGKAQVVTRADVYAEHQGTKKIVATALATIVRV
ncbi:PaaI family thioesterase [Ferrovibrio sp.]|uniref:PaaI family thioesterase n=1 Tax=Ferrovibrio sp. TaxID=1917215 RepID=UPI003D0D9D36